MSKKKTILVVNSTNSVKSDQKSNANKVDFEGFDLAACGANRSFLVFNSRKVFKAKVWENSRADQ